MRFPAHWWLLIGLPAFGFCFAYVHTTYNLQSTYYSIHSIKACLRVGAMEKLNIVQAAGQLHPRLHDNNGFSTIRAQICWATEVSGTLPRLKEVYEGALRSITRSRYAS